MSVYSCVVVSYLKTYLFIKKIVAINLMVFYAIFLIRCINQILNTLKENNIEN